jgi:tetratricopeptide (TPR) repeat protein
LKDADAARASYEKALSIYAAGPVHDARYVNDLSQRIFVLALLGRLQDARELLKESLLEYPNDGRVMSMQGVVEAVESDFAPFALPPE